jgi:hypothetical protein
MKARIFLMVIIALALSAARPQTFRAQQGAVQKSSVNLGEFVKELMSLQMDESRMQLVILLPHDFFVAATMAQTGKTAAAVEQDVAFLKPFLTVAVQNSTEGADGRSSYLSESEVRARAVLKLADGSEIRPLTSVPPMVAATMAAMKTLIAAEGDAGSANMHILVFPSKTGRGAPIVETKQKDKLTLVLKAAGNFKETSFVWRTPFDAATSAPDCPRCKAAMSSKWSYCPYDGQKLP